MPDAPSLHTLAEVAEADHVAFTGTRRGATGDQRNALRRVLKSLGGVNFHHGDCVGSDNEAHSVAMGCGYIIHLHPPLNGAFRAHCFSDKVAAPKPYLERNRDIVDASKVLIATPGEMTEQLRSGTWSTIRYARKHGRRVIIIFPDGSVSDSAEAGRG